MRRLFNMFRNRLMILIVLTSARWRPSGGAAGARRHGRTRERVVWSVCPRNLTEPYVKAGEMVALYCPQDSGSSHEEAKVVWIGRTPQERHLTGTSAAEQRKMGLLIGGRSLVILSASLDQQGNYSCSLGKGSRQLWFRLIVCTTQSRECQKRTRYPQICVTQEACTLHCPEVNVPAAANNITSKGTTWHKEGQSFLRDDHFPSVEENDQGEYRCTRSYLYDGKIYNMTFTVVLTVKLKGKSGQSIILSPQRSDVLNVDLGATVVVDCEAVMYSDFDEVFWLGGNSEVEMNTSFPVFYNETRESNATVIKMTASLVFKHVAEENLSKRYTCKLESVSGPPSSITITLAPRKAALSSLSLALGIASVVVSIVVTIFVLVKQKMDITLFLRGTICCRHNPTDGKSYDAFLMCYESYTDRGLNEDDRKCLQSVLEERFGYRVCLYHRDVQPGQAAAEAVLDCVDRSRTVVLVPTSSEPGPGSGLLSAIHAALVERQTRLIFIQTEKAGAPQSGSLPEALQLLGEAGDRVTWKGTSSTPHSSSFWKQLPHPVTLFLVFRFSSIVPEPQPQRHSVLCCATTHVMAMVQVLLLPLFLLLASLKGVCPRNLTEPYVKAGEMVALYCPQDSGSSHEEAKVVWIGRTPQERHLTGTSAAEQRKMGLLIGGRSLVILSASLDQQGNYSCSLGKGSRQLWFRLIVCTTQSRECQKRTRYPQICVTQEACTLHCPEVNVPAAANNITSKGTTWHKEGQSFLRDDHFPSVEENDQGEYRCTRSYLYDGKIYNMTFTVVLTVKLKAKKDKSAGISSPHKSDVFYVDLGTTLVIDCKAVMYQDSDEIFWLSESSMVEMNTSFPVFYNATREINASEIKMTASLVFNKVSEEDLSKIYTCELESVSGPPSSVNITLAQKPRPSYVSLALATVGVVVVMVLTVVIYVRFRINVTLFLRDSLGCHRSTSDGKSYDAFLMCYESYTDRGLNEDDRKCLQSVLEERFGYRVCLYHRDVQPGQAAAEAVLDCVDRSRTVVLVPTSSEPGPGSGLLSAIHAALVERQTRLIFIQTEKAGAPQSGSLPEALQLLGEAGDRVTWKGTSSTPHSSSFWKQLRYCLPAPQEASPIKLLP
ncbi:uncharacterized protein AB9W97_010674 [Spinachia spinachia]